MRKGPISSIRAHLPAHVSMIYEDERGKATVNSLIARRPLPLHTAAPAPSRRNHFPRLPLRTHSLPSPAPPVASSWQDAFSRLPAGNATFNFQQVVQIPASPIGGIWVRGIKLVALFRYLLVVEIHRFGRVGKGISDWEDSFN